MFIVRSFYEKKKKTTEKTTRYFSKKKNNQIFFKNLVNNRLFKDTHYCRNLKDTKAITTPNISKSQ